ncbi:MAG: hypothetical protein HY819_23330 [Acidobacteria bacterium]|nr:hypothetical protein [Acidobacteriota bacterium]
MSIEINQITLLLCKYTSIESGVSILAYTDSGSADLYVEGRRYIDILLDNQIKAGNLLHLRKRKATHYIEFDLLPPTPAELFIELGPLYNRLLQARLNSEQIKELLENTVAK